MIERAELCVHRNRTLKAAVMGSSSGGSSGKQPREVAAKLGAPAAAGLGEKAEQRAQAEEAHRIDHLPAASRRLDEAGLLERGEMKRQCRRRLAERRRQLAGRHAGRAARRQQPHQVEPRFLRQSGKAERPPALIP